MSDRWAIHIDIEGFSAKWDDTMTAFSGLNALIEGIFRVSAYAFPRPPARLFSHQFGDGFLIVSDFHENSLERATLIATSLLRHVLAVGAVAKASIAEGVLADVVGCYPIEIRQQVHNGRIHCGDGRMTIFPVMGTALINTVSLDRRSPSGPLLTVGTRDSERVGTSQRQTLCEKDVVAINWLRGEPPGIGGIQEMARLSIESESERVGRLRRYIENHERLTDAWKTNVRTLLMEEDY